MEATYAVIIKDHGAGLARYQWSVIAADEPYLGNGSTGSARTRKQAIRRAERFARSHLRGTAQPVTPATVETLAITIKLRGANAGGEQE